MEIGIVGLAGSGKSTLFEIMTGIKSREVHGETCIRGLATVPDERLEHLARLYQPAKVTPAKVPFVDVHAVGEKAWNTLRQNLSGTDGLVHVIDGYTTGDLADIVTAYRQLEDELVLSDLLVVENRLERLGKMSKAAFKPLDHLQLELLPSVKDHLEQGKALRQMTLSTDEAHALRSFSLWTLKPELIVINTAEGETVSIEDFRKETGIKAEVFAISALVEGEIASLPPEERREYLAMLGIEEPAFSRIITGAFKLLRQISFFTVGEDEVKAWTITEGTKAPQAAGTIHKDFEKGFIKAEVVNYEDFVALGSQMQAVKAAGKLRLEGRDYVVKDGDIITFRFHV